MRRKPACNRSDGARLLFDAERPARGDPVPLREAAAATGRRCMLGDEHRVPAKRRLLPVVRRLRRREASRDEPARVLVHRALPLRSQVVAFLRAERELTAKARLLKRREELVEVAHSSGVRRQHLWFQPRRHQIDPKSGPLRSRFG